METETHYEIRQPVLKKLLNPHTGGIKAMLVGKPLASFEVPTSVQITEAEAVCINGSWYVKAQDQGFWHDRWRRQ